MSRPIARPVAQRAECENARQGGVSERISTGKDCAARPSQYLTATRLRQLEEMLSPRDWEVLAFVAECRLASGKQLTLRFWSAERANDPTRARAARRTLKRLVDWRVLATLPGRTRGGVRGGSATLVYFVGSAGTRLLTARGAHTRRLGVPGERFVGHVLDCTELAVGLHLAHTRGELELLGIQHEPKCWRIFTGAMGARYLIRPDLFVRLGAGRHEDRWFVEVDRGTLHAGTLEAKARRYAEHMRSGSEQREHSVYPRVLWTVPDDPRARQLTALFDRQGEAVQAAFSICLAGEAVAFLAEEARR